MVFSKICPAGKGYTIHNSRETLSFIIPETIKEGVSLNATFTVKALFISVFIALTLFLTFTFLLETKQPVRNCFCVRTLHQRYVFLCSFLELSPFSVVLQPPETSSTNSTSGGGPRVPGKVPPDPDSQPLVRQCGPDIDDKIENIKIKYKFNKVRHVLPAKVWSLCVGFTVFKPPPPTPVKLNPGNDQFETQTKVSRESPPGDSSLQRHHAATILSCSLFHPSGLC